LQKLISITVLVVAQIAVMAVWFSSAAVIADLALEVEISPGRQALLSSSVQAGFAIGAVIYALLGLADRFDPRRVFMISALCAASANAALLIVPVGGAEALVARAFTGAFLAGVYPVGMKIAVGWGQRDRGLLVGLLVGALTLGSAAPHLLSFLGGTNWRIAVGSASLLATIGGLLSLLIKLGPFHATAPIFNFRVLGLAWRDRKIRFAYIGYLGHMWELYGMWAWIAIALGTSFSANIEVAEATSLAKLTAFFVVAAGAISCVGAGILADKIGKAETTIIAMIGSGSAALVAAFAFSGPPWLLILVTLFWGATIIADSAQFSALIADVAPPESAGALMTLQTALGFALTIITVQAAPFIAGIIGWPGFFCVLGLGPFIGVIAMSRLRKNLK